jgi:hypothetical protein
VKENSGRERKKMTGGRESKRHKRKRVTDGTGDKDSDRSEKGQ